MIVLPGYRVLRRGPSEQYPNGNWKYQKYDPNTKGWQGVNPSTGKVGVPRPDYHVEFPSGYKGPFDY